MEIKRRYRAKIVLITSIIKKVPLLFSIFSRSSFARLNTIQHKKTGYKRTHWQEKQQIYGAMAKKPTENFHIYYSNKSNKSLKDANNCASTLSKNLHIGDKDDCIEPCFTICTKAQCKPHHPTWKSTDSIIQDEPDEAIIEGTRKRASNNNAPQQYLVAYESCQKTQVISNVIGQSQVLQQHTQNKLFYLAISPQVYSYS